HHAIDWHQPHRFLDQELRKILPEAATGNRRVDKLVEVTLRGAKAREWVYIHLEVQGSHDPTFAERMYIYHYRAFDLFKRPVAGFAVLFFNLVIPGSDPGSRAGCCGLWKGSARVTRS